MGFKPLEHCGSGNSLTVGTLEARNLTSFKMELRNFMDIASYNGFQDRYTNLVTEEVPSLLFLKSL